MIERVQRALSRWQVSSTLLGGTFIYFTWIFWTLVIRYEDFRYIAHATMAHLLWVVCWAVITMPLLHEWSTWERARIREVCSWSQQTPEQCLVSNARLALLSEIRPIGRINAMASMVIASVALVLPIIQALFR